MIGCPAANRPEFPPVDAKSTLDSANGLLSHRPQIAVTGRDGRSGDKEHFSEPDRRAQKPRFACMGRQETGPRAHPMRNLKVERPNQKNRSGKAPWKSH